MAVIDQVSVTRSFSKKIQIKQYEPVDAFASVTVLLKGGCTEEDIAETSKSLFKLAVEEVERDIEDYYKTKVAPF